MKSIAQTLEVKPSNTNGQHNRYTETEVAEMLGWPIHKTHAWLLAEGLLRSTGTTIYVERSEFASHAGSLVTAGKIDSDAPVKFPPTLYKLEAKISPKAASTAKEQHTGDRFGRLLLMGEGPKDKKHGRTWECQCECGKTVVVRQDKLRAGHTTSCGCVKQERFQEHFVRTLQRQHATPGRMREIWRRTGTLYTDADIRSLTKAIRNDCKKLWAA